MAIMVLLSSCLNQDSSSSNWVPPGGNLENTLFYPRPSSIRIRELSLELLWNSGFIPLKRKDIVIYRSQFLSTGAASGDMFLGVFGDEISLFRYDGEPVFRRAGPSVGLLADIDRKGSLSVVAATQEGIFLYDIQGNLRRSARAEKDLWEVKICDLDNDGRLELLTSGWELEQAPKGSRAINAGKLRVRCYDALTLEPKWEYRTASKPHLAAIGDINNDGYKEVVLGTYAFDNGTWWADMVDTNRGYALALDRFGKRLWLQTLRAQYASIWPSIADLDGDGDMEVVVACGTWLRNWGGVYILNARDGSIMYKFPNKGNLSYPIIDLGIADLDGDGKKEIVCASLGKNGSFFVLDHRCNPSGMEYKIFPMNLDYDFINCQLEAINDLDGDGKPEIIGTVYIEKNIIHDPRFVYSKLTEPQLLILSSTLTLKTSLPLEEVCSDVIVSDLIQGGANELIVLGSEVSVFGVKEGER